ncbi:hypothetical protein ACHAXR_011360 [Thalassiosira sp. AJA248-18]
MPEPDKATAEEEEESTDSDDGEWVKLDMKLIDWNYMDFSRTLRVTTTLHTIKEVIKNCHGGNIASITVCKDRYQETNELRDDKLTLKQYGIDGSLNKSQAPVVSLHYDFKPGGCTEPDPILMC